MFTFFGDESASQTTTLYGVVAVPDAEVGRAEGMLRDLKREYQVADDAELHCYVLFHGNHRKDSPWSHLSEEETYEFAEELLRALSSMSCVFSVGAVHRSEYPEVLPAVRGIP